MLRRNILFTIVVVSILAITVTLSTMQTDNHRKAPEGEIKHFTKSNIEENIRLKDGLTIEDYIEKHIRVGNRVKYYCKKNEKRQSPEVVPEVTKKEVEKESYTPGVMLNHEVVPGDTLLMLAKKYDTTVYKIKKLNNISNHNLLKVGQNLKIIPQEATTYRIRRGDNLFRIAKMFDVDKKQIEELNNLDPSKDIWVGKKLIMPTTQKKIDSVLAAIEKKKREEEMRKKRYQRELMARLERQKKLREKKARELRAKKKREKMARLEKARRAFKYSPQKKFKHKMRVTATAYTSHRGQTDRTPFLAAWNNRIRPGMKIIAVSPDMIRRYGITNGVRVKIAGLPGVYTVRDKMHPKWRKRIDIYMGTNKGRAMRWGKRRVVLYY